MKTALAALLVIASAATVQAGERAPARPAHRIAAPFAATPASASPAPAATSPLPAPGQRAVRVVLASPYVNVSSN